MNIVTKWGFGSAPLKKETEQRYGAAIDVVICYITHGDAFAIDRLCESISTVKGLFSRILRQDQWDWFTVHMYLDYPSASECGLYCSMLSNLRKAINKGSKGDIEEWIEKLRKSNIEKRLKNYLDFSFSATDRDEYIYILSRREEPKILKIGMTTRNVIKRCQEINSATGMLYPLSPRAVYRVIDAHKAEHLVHDLLSEFRIRSDREFFIIEFEKANRKIEELLKRENLLFYK